MIRLIIKQKRFINCYKSFYFSRKTMSTTMSATTEPKTGLANSSIKPIDVLTFWFGPIEKSGSLPKVQEKVESWFQFDPNFDRLVSEKFESILQETIDGQ
jgi:hypothetical protein